MKLPMLIIGWFFIVVGVAVGLVITIEPMIYTSTPDQPYSPLWDVALDPCVAICILLGIVFTYLRKRGLEAEGPGGAITWDRLSASALFYGFVFIGIRFFWDLGAQLNWDTFSTGSEGVFGAVWIVVYALFTPLAITLGLRMQRAARAG